MISGGTGTAMVPDRCRISVDRRLLPGESGEDAQAQIDDAIASLDLGADDLGVRTELLMEIPSFELAAGSTTLVQGVSARLGRRGRAASGRSPAGRRRATAAT